MIVRVRFEFGDVELQALNDHLGEVGKARHQDVEVWIEGVVRSATESVVAEFYRKKEEGT